MDQQIKSKQRVADHGEVFTAAREVNAMLDLVGQETERVGSRFLEPACGDGNFLAEILRRKLSAVREVCARCPEDYEEDALLAVSCIYGIDLLADNVAACRHRLFAIWDGEYSAVCKNGSSRAREAVRSILRRNIVCGNALTMLFTDSGQQDTQMPITLPRWEIKHREASLRIAESKQIPDMEFDVIIGNPPYQRTVNESGKGLGAAPLYHRFIEQAIRLNPRYISMIVPARWFSGGVGLERFRKSMLSDRRLRHIVDYIDSNDCFPGVDINGGICYFLWDRQYSGPCSYTSIHRGRRSTALRDLNEHSIFIRRNEAVPIVQKVLVHGERKLSDPGGCSPQTPYGFLSTFTGSQTGTREDDCRILSSKGWMYVAREKVRRYTETIDLYKPMFSKLSCEHAGNPDKNGMYRVLSRMELLVPGEICTQSYLVACPSSGEAEARNAYNYLRTKFVRFLILQTLAGMNISIRNFMFVPWQDFTRPWTDADLYRKYGLTEAEIRLIEETIKPMEQSAEADG